MKVKVEETKLKEVEGEDVEEEGKETFDDSENDNNDDLNTTEEEAENDDSNTKKRKRWKDDNDEVEEGERDNQASTAEEDHEDVEEEDGDEEDEEDDDEADQSYQQKKVKRLHLSDREGMLEMLRSLPEEEVRRHEQFRRSHFDRGAIKRCMSEAIQRCTPSDRKVPQVTHVMSLVMAGMSKVFVGELTEEARRIMEKNGETGPIQPRHLREAHRKYYKRRPLTRGRTLRRLLK